MPQTWGEAGVVRGISGDDLTLSKEPSTDPGNTYLRIRRKDGGEWGPCKITWTPGSAVVTLDATDRAAAEAEFGALEPHLVDDGDEAPTYLLGEGTDYAFRGILVNMVPDGTGAQIELVIDDPAVHAADQGLSVPAAPQPGFLPPSAGAPAITAMSVHREISVTESLVTVSARHPAGAVSFRAQVSYDGNSWTPVYEGAVPAFSASVRREAFYVRMQAVGDLPGPWRVELVAAAPEEVRFPTNAPIRATELFDAATDTVKSAGDTISDLNTSILAQLNRIATEEDWRGRESDLWIRETDAARASIEETRVLIADEETARVAAFLELQADLTAAEAGISGNATAISGLDTRVTSAEGAITAQSTSITGVQAQVGDVSAGGFYRLQATVGPLPGDVSSEFVVALNAGTEGSPNWQTAGLALQILSGGLGSRAVFNVDQFVVTDGTTVTALFEEGQALFKSAIIPDLTTDKITGLEAYFYSLFATNITSATISTDQLTVGGTKIDADFLDDAAVTPIRESAASGTVTITDNGTPNGGTAVAEFSAYPTLQTYTATGMLLKKPYTVHLEFTAGATCRNFIAYIMYRYETSGGYYYASADQIGNPSGFVAGQKYRILLYLGIADEEIIHFRANATWLVSGTGNSTVSDCQIVVNQISK